VPGQAGNNHPTSIPTGVFKTKDGHINIAAAGAEIYLRLCKALGAEHLAKNPDYASDKLRSKNRDKLNAEIEEITKTKTSADWIELINKAGVPCGPIYKMDEVFADPQVKHIGIAQPVEHPQLGRIEVVGQAVTLSRTPSQIRTPTPERGQHTDEVLRQLGYDDAAISGLRAKGVI
jgi:formyl-CoA transferase